MFGKQTMNLTQELKSYQIKSMILNFFVYIHKIHLTVRSKNGKRF